MNNPLAKPSVTRTVLKPTLLGIASIAAGPLVGVISDLYVSAMHAQFYSHLSPDANSGVALMGAADFGFILVASMFGFAGGLFLAIISVRRRGGLGGFPLFAVLFNGVPLLICACLMIVGRIAG